ncbi:hypothetical protein PVAG01_02698 [Phlyctema vagabunda]|uniref:Uncharacterized protein n=1 Tax=Phlyctema vagabunda TaxID=108571 RepID=A0ABR4PRC0_9HELO
MAAVFRPGKSSSPVLVRKKWPTDFDLPSRTIPKSVVQPAPNIVESACDIDIGKGAERPRVQECNEAVSFHKQFSATKSIDNVDSCSDRQESALLALPYEIRHQIYMLLLDSHAMHHAHLIPLPFRTSTKQHPHTVQSYGFGLPISLSNPFLKHINQPPRPRGKICTALMLSCKRVYLETHKLAFEENEFIFVNWFWSGAYAAYEFSRHLAPWQCVAMRYVGLEVVARDLVPRPGTDSPWEAICAMWSGVRGMTLGIKGPKEIPHAAHGDVLNLDLPWVTQGLLKLGNLRWIELEIEACVDIEAGRAFSQGLQNKLNANRMQDDFVTVTLYDPINEKN